MTLAKVIQNSNINEEAIEIQGPAGWIPLLAAPHRASQRDIHRLYQLYGDKFVRNDPRSWEIERNYATLYEGTDHLYQTVKAQQEITREWICTRLIRIANAVQTFTHDIWEVIQELSEEQQTTTNRILMMTHLNDAIAFLQTSNAEWQKQQALYQQDLDQPATHIIAEAARTSY